MHVFCVKELGFSDGAAYNRVGVARVARRWPAVLEALRTGAVHLSGLRVLVPHFRDANHEALLAEAAGKSKREIEEMAARLSPKPPVPDRVSMLPAPRAASLLGSDVDSGPETSRGAAAMSNAIASPVTRTEDRRPVVAPLSEDTFQFQFTGPRALRDKLREAQDLLRHRVPNGALAAVFEKALDALIVNLKKERFAVGREPRNDAAPALSAASSRNIPDPVKRAALAIESFHKASLVHDDIEDDDTYRYGQETLHRVHGTGVAINVGDYLIGLGYRLISRDRKELGAEVAADVLDKLADAHLKLSEGQGAELLWRDAADQALTTLAMQKRKHRPPGTRPATCQ